MPPKDERPKKKRTVGGEAQDSGIADTGGARRKTTRLESEESDVENPDEQLAREQEVERRKREILEGRLREAARLREEAERLRIWEEEANRDPDAGDQDAGAAAGAGQAEDAPAGGNPPPEREEDDNWDAEEEDAAIMGARVNANQLAVLGEFKGEGDDVELFVMQVIRCQEAFQWTHLVTAQLVQTCLKGVAAKWLRSKLKTALPAAHMNEWDHMVPAPGGVGAPVVAPNVGLRFHLLTRFREAQNGQAAVEAVGDLKQRAGEDVDEFLDRVLLAMDRKNYTTPVGEAREQPEYKMRLAQDAFIFLGAGLRDDLRKTVLAIHPAAADLEELLARARTVEVSRRKDRPVAKLSEISEGEAGQVEEAEAAGGSPAIAEMTLQELQQEVEALRKNMFRGAADVECWKCHAMGHYAYECQVRSKSSTPSRGRGRGRGAGGAPRGRKPPGSGSGATGRGGGSNRGGNGRFRGRGSSTPGAARGGRKRIFVVDADGYLEDEETVDYQGDGVGEEPELAEAYEDEYETTDYPNEG